MRAAHPEDFHCARIAMKDKATVNGHRWQSDLNILKFGKIGFGFGEVFSDGVLLVGTGGLLQVTFQLFDLLRHGGEFVFPARNAEPLHIRSGRLRRDDFDTCGPGIRIGFVSLGVVPMEVGVHHVFHGSGGQFLDLFDECARRRRC